MDGISEIQINPDPVPLEALFFVQNCAEIDMANFQIVNVVFEPAKSGDTDWLPTNSAVAPQTLGPRQEESLGQGPKIDGNPYSAKPMRDRPDIRTILKSYTLDHPYSKKPYTWTDSPRTNPKKSSRRWCNACGRIFLNTMHFLSHCCHKPFKCDKCRRVFKTEDGLTVHKQSHIEEKPYKCQFCDVRCRLKYALERHVVIHTAKMTRPTGFSSFM